MPIYLHALALRNYRGIGPDWQLMSPFCEFNFFIGANNTGKSTVLNFISKWLPLGEGKKLGPAEVYRHGINGQAEMAIGISSTDFLNRVMERIGNAEPLRASVEALTRNIEINSTVWLRYAVPTGKEFDFLPQAGAPPFKSVIEREAWDALWRKVTSQGGGDLNAHWIPETLRQLRNFATTQTPRSILIPAVREIGPKGEEFSEYSGRGLVDRLAEMQNPDIGQREERAIFDKINRFLEDVTGYESAYIEIPYNREHILVHIDGNVLPLWALGTGIQEVILIASYCTINSDVIVCMEEPEIHLHPVLQRKLLRYLRDNTSNQYFIATHSAAFIDTPGAAIFHVRHEDGQTRVSESVLRSGRYAVCQDLGYKASDIVQANAVIWCEGPSDRVYLNWWIAHVAAELVEGIHYSIMFYGGRNLSHLSANDDDVEDFISLRSLNRNSAILIDSDRGESDGPINSTKERICAEFREDGGIAWVTAGREIENYVSFTAIQAAIESVHSRSYAKPANSGGPFDHAIQFRPKIEDRARQKPVTADKVKVARAVCEKEPDLGILDLRDRITTLVEMIRAANE